MGACALALDTRRWGAHVTALDALWAGAPLLSAPGEALASRASHSLLHSVGMPKNLRHILEGGPPEGIITRFNAMFGEKEKWTAQQAEQIMHDLGW